MTRVVLDSNVWISGYYSAGTARRLLDAAFAGRFTPLLTHAILQEVYDVLSEDFHFAAEQVLDIQRTMLGISELVEIPQMTAHPVRDPKDLHIIACAITAHADAIVTGDHDLLALCYVRSIPVHTIRQFLQTLAA
ncbi:MAG: putative toxin-antitoxin system toxin component, PIN family [Candidatus Omnitrophica bacterium]|nr:putative toxin-antitoxin system toxin component, PIN family [Candidatus Omnitrophota bacterium]